MTEPKTIADLRVKIAELSAEAQARGTSQARGVALYAFEQALRWAAGEDVDADDLTRPIEMKWRRAEDGTYVSTAGYRIEKRYETTGAAGTVWASERPDSEPMGWNVHSSLDYAKQQCQTDWGNRLRNVPDL